MCVSNMAFDKMEGNEPETSHFLLASLEHLPYENHMSAGRLACQLKRVKLDHIVLRVYHFRKGIVIQF